VGRRNTRAAQVYSNLIDHELFTYSGGNQQVISGSAVVYVIAMRSALHLDHRSSLQCLTRVTQGLGCNQHVAQTGVIEGTRLTRVQHFEHALDGSWCAGVHAMQSISRH
jgi:hypothetical protein